MSILKNCSDPSSLNLYERLAEDRIQCDGCHATLLYLNGDASPQQLFEAQVMPIVYKHYNGKVTELHFCGPCQKHQPQNVKDALEREFNALTEVSDQRQQNLEESDSRRADLEVQIAEICEDRDQKIKALQQELAKSEAIHKAMKTTLENLELKLGKLVADDFSAKFREPIFVVLLQEGEEIVRRFVAGPPGSQDEITAFTEKLKKWLNSSQKARESTTTHRTMQAGASLRAAFQKKQGATKPE